MCVLIFVLKPYDGVVKLRINVNFRLVFDSRIDHSEVTRPSGRDIYRGQSRVRYKTRLSTTQVGGQNRKFCTPMGTESRSQRLHHPLPTSTGVSSVSLHLFCAYFSV